MIKPHLIQDKNESQCMTVIQGYDALINIAEETDQRTRVSSSNIDTALGRVQGDVELPDPEKDFDFEYYVGAGRKPANKFEGQTVFEGGSIPIKPVDITPFAILLGDDITASTVNLRGTSDPRHYSLGVAYNKDNFNRVYVSAFCTGGEITVANDSELQVDLDMDALDAEIDSTFTGVDNVPEQEPTWSFINTSSDLTIAGKSIARLLDFSVTVDQGSSAEHYVNSQTEGGPYEIVDGRPEVTATATVNVTDKDLYQNLQDGVKFDTTISFQNPTGTLTITLKDCNITSAPHPIPEEGPIEVDVEMNVEDITVDLVV